MIEYRSAETRDTNTLKRIWQLTFGDSKKFIDFYFANRFNPNNTLLLLKELKIVSMLTRIPVKLVTPHEGYEGEMFYAIATHPDYQKQGLATLLTEFANVELKKKGKDFSIIVPANQGLFQFYLRQGYEIGFEIRQALLDAKKITGINNSFKCNILPITPSDYNQRRKELLKDKNHINYEEIEIAYQQKISRFSGADLYLINCHPGIVQGLMAAERIDNQKVVIKECLMDEEYLLSAIKELSLLLPAREYIVRTPEFLGKSQGGLVTPFAVIKNLGGKKLLNGQDNYLGLAFD